jgi:DNA-binding transcriptional ArsR family regulator
MRRDLREKDPRVYELHASVCKAFAHPRRLELLDLLRSGPKEPSTLAELTGLSPSNVSQHLTVMRNQGIVHAVKDAGRTMYMVPDQRLFEACATLREVLRERLREGGRLAAEGFRVVRDTGGHSAVKVGAQISGVSKLQRRYADAG